MKPKFIILGIVLCVLSSAPLKADPDGLDSATISGTYELFPKSVPEPGALTLLTVGVLMTLLAWEKVKFDRGHKNNQDARREAYWQVLGKRDGLQAAVRVSRSSSKGVEKYTLPVSFSPHNPKRSLDTWKKERRKNVDFP